MRQRKISGNKKKIHTVINIINIINTLNFIMEFFLNLN